MSEIPQTPAAVAYALMRDLLYADNKGFTSSGPQTKATRQDILQAYRDAIAETSRGK